MHRTQVPVRAQVQTLVRVQTSSSSNTNTSSGGQLQACEFTNNAIPIDQGKFSQPRFRLSASLYEGYDDNTETSKTNKNPSGFTNFQANAFADLGNSRTLFTIGVTAGASVYYDRPGQKVDKLASLTLNLAERVNDKFTLTLNTYFTYQVEPDFTLQVEQNRINGQYFYTGVSLSGAYEWTRRFQTVTSYNFVGIFYQDATAKVANDYYSHTCLARSSLPSFCRPRRWLRAISCHLSIIFTEPGGTVSAMRSQGALITHFRPSSLSLYGRVARWRANRGRRVRPHPLMLKPP